MANVKHGGGPNKIWTWFDVFVLVSRWGQEHLTFKGINYYGLSRNLIRTYLNTLTQKGNTRIFQVSVLMLFSPILHLVYANYSYCICTSYICMFCTSQKHTASQRVSEWKKHRKTERFKSREKLVFVTQWKSPRDCEAVTDKTVHEYLAAKLKLQNTKQKKSRWKENKENKTSLKTPVGEVATFHPPMKGPILLASFLLSFLSKKERYNNIGCTESNSDSPDQETCSKINPALRS